MKRYLVRIIIISLMILINQGITYSQDNKISSDNNTTAPEEINQADNQSTADKKETDTVKDKNGSEIIITATKTEINKRETGASITIITADQIEQKQKMNLVDILKTMPGTSLSSSSSLGGLADMYIRGAESNHVVVLLDGVKVNDPTSPSNGFDFAHITTDNIERIEVIRGSQSTLYGSDAIGGVINIITKKGKGKPQLTVKAEGGSYATFKEMAGVSGSNEWVNYSFAVSRLDSRGFSRTSSWKGLRKSFITNPHDGYENTSVSSRIGVKTIHDSWLTLSLRYIGTWNKIADGPYQEDKNHTYSTNNLAANLLYAVPVFSWWESSLSVSYNYQHRRDRDRPDVHEYTFLTMGSIDYMDMQFKGNRIGIEFKNKFKIADMDEIICGATYEKESAATMPWWYSVSQYGGYTMDPRDQIDKTEGTWAAYLQNHLKLKDRIFIIAGGRYTKPDHFTDTLDFSASGSFILPVTETRLKANIGTGYKVPSIYQRYYNRNLSHLQQLDLNMMPEWQQYITIQGLGNINLKPEQSLSWDAGIEQPLWKEKIILEANFFTIDYRKMIYYDSYKGTYGQYINIDAISRGVECIAIIKPVKDLSIEGHYTFTLTNGKSNLLYRGELLRRPKHRAGFFISYSFLEKGNINLGFNYAGKRRDYYHYPYTSYLDPYYTFDLAASWWIIEQLQAFFRIENLLNRKYEEIWGYRTPGISFYGGLKAQI